MKTIKANVHRLPTEDYTKIWESKGSGINYYPKKLHQVVPEGAKFQHLYITTDEEIKEGDAYYSKFTKQVHINAGDSKIEWCNTKSSRYRKIIATTDSLLKYVDVLDHHYVDKIPQHIIEAYVKKPFDEVEVEYESHGCYTNGTWNHVEYKPKLNQDGTLAVSLVKFIDDFDYSNNPLHPVIEEKMYSREEVGSKIKEFVKEYAYEWDMDDINEWIEENL